VQPPPAPTTDVQWPNLPVESRQSAKPTGGAPVPVIVILVVIVIVDVAVMVSLFILTVAVLRVLMNIGRPEEESKNIDPLVVLSPRIICGLAFPGMIRRKPEAFEFVSVDSFAPDFWIKN
jgi:hypothetical protein